MIDLGRITSETLEQLARVGQVRPSLPDCRKIGAVPPDHPSVPAPRSRQDTPARRPPVTPSNNPSAGVALQEAPEHFLDQGRWNDLVSSCGSHEAALNRISHPDAVGLILLRRQVGEQKTDDGAKARALDKIYRLGLEVVENLVERLKSGEYIATGFQPPSIERVTIPSELWSKLIPNFQDGTSTGGGYSFSCVRIVKAVDLARRKSDVSERIEMWLTQRLARHGEEPKKTLMSAAQREFGDERKSRAFDAAYRRVYARKPGRPSKNNMQK